MKAIYRYENGKKFMGIAATEEIAIRALFEAYADKDFFKAENFWGSEEKAIKAWWKGAKERWFVIEDARVWR